MEGGAPNDDKAMCSRKRGRRGHGIGVGQSRRRGESFRGAELTAQPGLLLPDSGMQTEDAYDIDPARKDSIDDRVREAAEGRPARQDGNQRICHRAAFDPTKEIVKLVNERGAQAGGLRLVPRDRLVEVAFSFREEGQRILGFHART